jgi:hypothetical protein
VGYAAGAKVGPFAARPALVWAGRPPETVGVRTAEERDSSVNALSLSRGWGSDDPSLS